MLASIAHRDSVPQLARGAAITVPSGLGTA